MERYLFDLEIGPLSTSYVTDFTTGSDERVGFFASCAPQLFERLLSQHHNISVFAIRCCPDGLGSSSQTQPKQSIQVA
jgi:hypothetical protein